MKKRILAALAVLSLAAYGAQSQAKKDGIQAPSAEQLKKYREDGAKTVPAILTDSGVTGCSATDQLDRGEGSRKEGNATVKIHVYEVACQAAEGYVIVKAEKAPKPDVYPCAQLAAGGGLTCVSDKNADLKAQVGSIITKAGASCQVNDYKILGYVEKKFVRYELACTSGEGFILDAPVIGSSSPLSKTDCLTFTSQGGTCSMTTKAQWIKLLTPVANQGDSACQVSDARWIGSSQTKNTSFIEFACANKPGFVAETLNYSLVKATPCEQATGIGGGCTLTDMKSIMAGKTAETGKKLKAAGVDCAATEQRVIGIDGSGREVSELVCSNTPIGYVAYIPQDPSNKKATLEVRDCVTASASDTTACKLTSAATQKALVEKLIKAKGKDCDVSEFKVHGLTQKGSLLEIACTNKRGYITELVDNATKLDLPLACHIAARSGDRCEIPGNGSFTGSASDADNQDPNAGKGAAKAAPKKKK